MSLRHVLVALIGWLVFVPVIPAQPPAVRTDRYGDPWHG
jgi:hypothetical protein